MKKQIINICLLLSMAYTGCTHKDEPQPAIALPSPPNPNSHVPAKYITHHQSFVLAKDVYGTSSPFTLTSMYAASMPQLWVLGDLLVVNGANPSINLSESGIIPVTHIVTINDTLQNIFVDTLYIGTMYIQGYTVESISYSNVYIDMLSYTNNARSQTTAAADALGVFPFQLGLNYYTNYFNVYTDSPVTFKISNASTDQLVYSTSLDLNTVGKKMISDHDGKLLCVDANGNKIWMRFSVF